MLVRVGRGIDEGRSFGVRLSILHGLEELGVNEKGRKVGRLFGSRVGRFVGLGVTVGVAVDRGTTSGGGDPEDIDDSDDDLSPPIKTPTTNPAPEMASTVAREHTLPFRSVRVRVLITVNKVVGLRCNVHYVLCLRAA